MRRALWWVFGSLMVAAGAVFLLPLRLSHRASQSAAVNPQLRREVAFDVWGESISPEAGQKQMATAEGRERLSPAQGAVVVDEATLTLGREAFYGETFGNEVPLSEVLGLLDGPVTLRSFAEAILKLRGGGTTNLQVRLVKAARVAGRQFAEGQLIDTGLQVPKGGLLPLGVVLVKRAGGGVRAGISCALCHSSVDPETLQVIHGAPNRQVRAGLLLALAPNTAVFYAHSDIGSLASVTKPGGKTVVGSDGASLPLPDAQALEEAVDAAVIEWPPGSFDSMVDLEADATQNPSSWTRGAYPYGWSGFASLGPFHGLSSLNNNVHGLNSDPFTIAEAAPVALGIDKELYLALALQNASNPRFRYDPASGVKPSEFLAKLKTQADYASLNEVIPSPTAPRGSLLTPAGLLTSPKGRRVWEQINAISAWQNSLVPPELPLRPRGDGEKGRTVFAKARCAECHAGEEGTNHRIVPLEEIRSEPVRARALRRLWPTLQPPSVWAFDQTVPVGAEARKLSPPLTPLLEEQARLAFAWENAGGYKVPTLIGLPWRAPYLHDGGVAAGADPNEAPGLAALTRSGKPADGEQSLHVLLDRTRRGRVVAANEADGGSRRMNVRGIGHEFWVDAEAGFSAQEQDDLVAFLLNFRAPGQGK